MNQNEKSIKDLFQIELILMEGRKSVFDKRLELLTQIKNVYNKGADSLTQVALPNSDLYRVPKVPSVPRNPRKRRTEIINLEHKLPLCAPKIKQQTGLNIGRKNQNNQQETSVNDSEIQYLEQVNRQMEDQNSEIEIEVDIPCQIQKLFKTGRYQMKKRKQDGESNCPVCGKLFSSRAAVNRHVTVFHRIESNGGLVNI